MSKLRFLPGARFGGLNGGSGRNAGSRINGMANEPRDLTATVAARGALLPILYGRRDIPGLIFAKGMISTDLVVGVLWCIGEIDAIENVYINDAAPPGGVTITNYLGTPTQGVDATLASAIAAYADTVRMDTPDGKRGWAYTVARIPTGQITAWPRFRATVRGLKVYDPRPDPAVTVYSDNAALCMADLASDPDFGLDMEVLGIGDAADWCDTLLGGAVERCKLSLYIASGATASSYLDLMSEYAECFWVREGSGIRLIPDEPVDLGTVSEVNESDIIQDSLSITAETTVDTPTEVEIQYTEPSATASEAWGFESAIEALAGVEIGETSRVPTSISMEGVYRYPEAANKALSRLRRLQNRFTAKWDTLDAAVAYQTGDVRIINHVTRGVYLPVRITNVEMIGGSRYRVTASNYDESHYPNDLALPGSEGTVPVGAIIIAPGADNPSGWESFTAADGKLLVGASATLASGTTGGTATFTISGNTSSSGAHGGSDVFPVDDYRSSPPGSEVNKRLPVVADPSDHLHTYTTGSVSYNPYVRKVRLMRKITSAGLKIPANSGFLGANGLSHATIERQLTHAGRMLEAATSFSTAGSATLNVPVTIGSTDDTHTHVSLSPNSGLSYPPDASPFAPRYDPVNGGGAHTHSSPVTMAVDRKPRRRRIALYSGSSDMPVIPGVCVWWENDASLPTDWVWCDGTAPTMDTRENYFEIAAAGNEDTLAGDNTISISGTTPNQGHSHRGSSYTDPSVPKTVLHEETVFHNHTVSGSIGPGATARPLLYRLRLIMYAPGS